MRRAVARSPALPADVIDARDVNDRTALHFAAYHGRVQLCALLLQLCADPAASDQSGATPADVAERKGHARLARGLRQIAASQAARLAATPSLPDVLPADLKDQVATHLPEVDFVPVKRAHHGDGRRGHHTWVGLRLRTDDDWQEDPYNFRKDFNDPAHPAHAISEAIFTAVRASDASKLREVSLMRGYAKFFKGWDARVGSYRPSSFAAERFRLWESYGQDASEWSQKGFPGVSVGDTILHLAVRNGEASGAAGVSVELCRALCELGAPPSRKNGDGRTASELLSAEAPAEVRQGMEALVREFPGGEEDRQEEGAGEDCESAE